MATSDSVILCGVVGSTAYGLARPGSDVDRLGVFVAPTLEIAGLHWTGARETRTNSGPGHDDFTEHEVGKFLRLALKCNPTITELLWLPEYEVTSAWGRCLTSLRESVLSRRLVHDAYLGYATAQVKRLSERGDGTFSSDTRKRTAKHARHTLRLARQGRELLETGRLTVRVSNPEEYWAFDDMPVEEMLEVFERAFAETRSAYESSVLPERPDAQAVDDVLFELRAEFM
jgi:predicted nucleotidyltransferase